MVLEKATKMTLSDFVSKYLRQPSGLEHDALWQIDYENDGILQANCSVQSDARDFARFGKLYLQNGQWNGQQLVSANFLKKSIQPTFSHHPEYAYGWWLENYRNLDIYYMRGHLGQFVIVIPNKDLIIVRLGHLKGLQTTEKPHSEDLYLYIDEVLIMTKQ